MSKKYLISSCLAGKNCTYKASNHYIAELSELVKNNQAVIACPEVLGGLPIPRKSAEIIYNTKKQMLVKTIDGEDVTAQFLKGAKATLQIAQNNDVDVAIMQPRSPSCGCGKVYDGTFTRTMTEADGITVAMLKEHGVKVVTPEQFLNMKVK